ncbi:hypothetical protein ACH33_04970 [Aneurinibacillus sp. XH2]|uniref:hypothetical protein n=1 Tax=Aneurinibacillus sp. XH2 TaxID=1450761 RepID=UPI00070BF1DD|nr:hypothetical protein [Aneurinibacillus sp. XH2]AMA72267.1 hypothetical protein ACH33_04970 [Aneurinibacillus sp. XH2]
MHDRWQAFHHIVASEVEKIVEDYWFLCYFKLLQHPFVLEASKTSLTLFYHSSIDFIEKEFYIF